MTALAWSPELTLNHPQMDHTHEEFVELLGAAATALPGPEPELLAAFETLVAHTIEHFGQEDRWMAATGFAPENCHAFQHQAVLQVMRECARQAREPSIADFEPLRVAVGELAIWFPQHAQQMDAALAQHLAAVGFDAATGTLREPALAGAEPISGCGGGSCG
ncbi:MAG: hemerythrin [Burkholderiales bacterium PBB5]|nr:MAG: hemerythrin [Burkholderiales bacterium PBB5]